MSFVCGNPKKQKKKTKEKCNHSTRARKFCDRFASPPRGRGFSRCNAIIHPDSIPLPISPYTPICPVCVCLVFCHRYINPPSPPHPPVAVAPPAVPLAPTHLQMHTQHTRVLESAYATTAAACENICKIRHVLTRWFVPL